MNKKLKKKSFKKIEWNIKEHALKKEVPEICLSYEARVLKPCKILYFNFDLAHEMGMIDSTHSYKMTPELEKQLIQNFSIRIINEYDKVHRISYPYKIKNHSFIATRYLQIQHKNKKGKSSGDGRSVWNGTYKNKNKIWDIHTRGVGVTRLAPGQAESDKPLASGNRSSSYGCGLAELDELLASALTSKIFHLLGISTERVLCIIDQGKGLGVGVRVGENLLRPAHLFMYLKQGDYENLKKLLNYFIDRQFKNKKYSFSSNHPKAYSLFLDQITKDFAKKAAFFERNYIFVWMDWDGDNILMDGGIIDYGSVRHFGLRHDAYRYDDADRFSTNLNEQYSRSRMIIQSFVQIVNFLKSQEKKAMNTFSNDKQLKKYDEIYHQEKLKIFLSQLGFSELAVKRLMKDHLKKVSSFFKNFEALESIKRFRKKRKVADGVNNPALLNMRKFPSFLLNSFLSQQKISEKKLFFHLRSKKASYYKCSFRIKRLLTKSIKQYKSLIESSSQDVSKIISFMQKNINQTKKEHMTGNGSVYAVEELFKIYKNRSKKDISYFIKLLASLYSNKEFSDEIKKEEDLDTITNIQEIVEEFSEDI